MAEKNPAESLPRESRLRRMVGRDPDAETRAATPLELLFDLCFVVAFGIAADQFAHLVAQGHLAEGLIGFTFAMFSLCWAWINFSWFASAYDTDDWFYRVATMVQMMGVIVLALGLPVLFHSIEDGARVDNTVVVAGYIIMRIALVAQWLRVAVQSPESRATALTYAGWVTGAQVGWTVVAIVALPLWPTIAIAVALFVVEFAGPVVAERKQSGTPWHAHHIAERYGLLAIIALGEGIFGTVSTVSALVEEQGWSPEAIVVVVAGVGITFGLWWIYFLMPSGPLLAGQRSKGFIWGYGHIAIYASIAAVGAGLHVAAYVIEGEAVIGVFGAILAVAIPIVIYSVALFAVYTYLLGDGDRFHLGLLVGMVAVLALAAALALAGAPLGVCLLIVTVAPAVVVVGYETIGHRHQADALQRALGT